jgi:N-hydroxyarylamine O-acetyltransferase
MKNIIEAQNFNLPDYLKRIKLTKTPTPTIAFIREMMQQHLFNIPFENLDVQAGKIVSLVPEHIVDKIVHQNRGGYCYEVNGLLALALQKLGISCYFTAAHSMTYPTRRPRTHLVIIAKIEGNTYLLDTGFGSHGIRLPMDLSQKNKEIVQDGQTYKLEKKGSDFNLYALVHETWLPQYSFKKQAYDYIDFAPVNYLNSTHPDSIFVKAPLVILYNPKGKKILSGNTIKYYVDGQMTERVFDKSEYATILKEEFNLSAPSVSRALSSNILEVAILDVIPNETAAFQQAFQQAEKIIASMNGYLNHSLKRCVEKPNRYILLVNWIDLAAHIEGFRQSVEYQEWKRLLHHFYDPFPTVEHYETVA